MVFAVSTRALAQDDDLLVPSTTPPAAGAVSSSPAVAPKTSAPPAALPSAAAGTSAATAAAAAEIAELRSEVSGLRDEVRAVKDQQSSHPFLEVWDDSKSLKSQITPWDIPGRDGIWVTGFIQSQYEMTQNSQDALTPSGQLVNQDRFLVRRARLKLLGEWKFAKAAIEFNGDTTSGFNFNLQKAEATLQYRPDPDKVSIAQATLGLFDVPFGFELPESARSRPFMERTTMNRAFWPGEPDLGLRLSGGIAFFRWTIAAVNGHPLNSPQYPGQDPIAAKDAVFRFGVDTAPRKDLTIAGNVSVLEGTGFYPGTSATASSVEWNNAAAAGGILVPATGLQGVPAEAATPSATFPHWAVGADLEVGYKSPIGKTKLYGELILAQNLDRGMFIADPAQPNQSLGFQAGVNVRELGWYVGIIQEITEYGLVGFRYDYYNPNADFFEYRGPNLLPFSDAISTFSPLVGVVVPHRAKFLVQYDVIRNYLALDAQGVPANLKMNTLTLRLQVDL
jgi:HAMP domain-containing protein